MTRTTKKATTTATVTTAADANAARLEKMRAKLTALETEAETIIALGDAMSAADRLDLLRIVNVAYHDSGKIEMIYSIDSTAACDFCASMRKAAEDNILLICGSCYAAADAWKEAAWRRHKLNALIFSTVLFSKSELATLPIGSICRFNEDGDTVNETMARNYIRIILSHTATHFGYWFKNRPAVEAGLHAEGIHDREHLPANVRFIQSSLLIGFETSPAWFADAVFTVYPDAATTAEAIAKGAHECNGRKCRICGFTCYLAERRPEPIRIAEVLRAGKERRARIMAAYLAKKAAA